MIKIIEKDLVANVSKITGRASMAIVRKEDGKVQQIIKQIKKHGDAKLLDFTNRFDKTEFKNPVDFRVTGKEIDRAMGEISPQVIGIIKKAIGNIKKHHENQMPKSWMVEGYEKGTETGIVYRPIDSAGVYVPGGTAVYPSTVLMNVIPAQIAGVRRIVMVTPPAGSGEIDPLILASAGYLGITEIYKIGGAQAIAALAFGTKTIPRVDKIVGPGNIWVTLAKKQLYGTVGIDKLAGPSDITILADEQAPAAFVAADLISQAEHDVLASSVAVVRSRKQALEIKRHLISQVEALPRKDIIKKSLKNYGAIFVVSSTDHMIEIANIIAPEHLEIMFENPEPLIARINNAGAIFCGYYTPEALGDYLAGPNHVLPTGGTARFSSPLGVDDFLKKSSVIKYSREAACKEIKDIETFARLEGLDGHAYSMTVRGLAGQ